MIDIEICSREEAGAILSSPSRRKGVVLLVSIGEPDDPAPAGFRNVSPRMRFLFADTNQELGGATADDVARLIRTAQSLAERSGRVVIHCQAGISRSTAAATIFYAVLLGEGAEDEAIARVLASRDFALPNRRMIRLADEILGRSGKLVDAVERALA
ncbi:MAG TPA: hypothetical protein VG323_01755 [Thermoanaerobaculia bacterium]|nr:hypothetical protein [Thermoanaerobaculia bacterium]